MIEIIYCHVFLYINSSSYINISLLEINQKYLHYHEENSLHFQVYGNPLFWCFCVALETNDWTARWKRLDISYTKSIILMQGFNHSNFLEWISWIKSFLKHIGNYDHVTTHIMFFVKPSGEHLALSLFRVNDSIKHAVLYEREIKNLIREK